MRFTASVVTLILCSAICLPFIGLRLSTRKINQCKSFCDHMEGVSAYLPNLSVAGHMRMRCIEVTITIYILVLLSTIYSDRTLCHLCVYAARDDMITLLFLERQNT
jgi:hypothetical protein